MNDNTFFIKKPWSDLDSFNFYGMANAIPARKPLTGKEKAKRKVKRKMAQESRLRNRRK